MGEFTREMEAGTRAPESRERRPLSPVRPAPPLAERRSDPLSWAILTLASSMFATGYIIARAVSDEGGTEMFVAQALFAAALFMSLTGRAGRPVRRAHFWPILLNGALTPFIVFLVLEGSKVITPSLAAIIVISNALLIALFSWALGRKRFTPPQVAALLSGFAGVVWISLDRGALGGEFSGMVMLALASVLVAVVTVAVERPAMELGGMVVTRWVFRAAFVSAAAAVAVSGGMRFHSVEQTALAFALGVFSMGLPVLFFNVGMGRIGAADAAPFKLLIPFFALGYGALILDEAPSPSSAAAGLLVMSSLAAYHRFGRAAQAAPPSEGLF